MISSLLRKKKDPHFERTYAARSWTEGEDTVVTLDVAIAEIGPKAKMAAFGMKWGSNAQLDALEALLAGADR